MQSSSAQEDKSYEELLKERDALIAQQREEIATLVAQVRALKQFVFGKSSEKLSSSSQQTSLFSLPETPEVIPQETVTIPEHERHKRPGRKPLPADLPRERIEHEPEERQCTTCGRELVRIGEEPPTEELEYVPARFKVIEHIRVKRACPCCKNEVVQGTLPPGAQVIDKARPGPGLLAHLIVSKYCDHLPLNRQEQILARHGIDIPRQRMCDWIGAAVEQYLLLVALSLKKSIRLSGYVRVDETGLDVQSDEKQGKLHAGQLWGMLSDEGDVYFEYARSRSKTVATSLLTGITGVVQTDWYAGYREVCSEPASERLEDIRRD